jgi:hypothetical protein
VSSRPSQFYALPKLEGEQRKKALQEPGPSWREYAQRELLRWWFGLAVLIFDGWIIAAFLLPLDLPLMLSLLALATYLELLGWRLLWYEPHPETPWRSSFLHSRWFYPVAFGRWSKAAENARAGRPVAPGEPAEHGAEEFL